MSVQKFNPYVGLRPFHADENLLFFGRDQQTLELLQRLHKHRFVAVVGGSGSGKSSLIRAGLIPALKGGYLVEDSSKWFITTMKPGSSPVYNLAETLLRQVDPKANEEAISELVIKIKRERTSAILNLLSPLRKEKNANFFLLIDQFEELFRFSMEQQDSAKKTQAIDFVNLVLELSKQKALPFYVVLTMRSDFIGDCAQFRDLPEAMNKSQYLVPRITRQDLKNIIEGPARLYGGNVDPLLTVKLINDLGKVKDELPLLQHAMMRMWDFEVNDNKSGALDVEDYQQIGGIESALSDHADEALTRLKNTDFEIGILLFQALTAIDENGRKIRRPLLLSYLIELTGETESKLLDIIQNFIKDGCSFLIVQDTEDGDKLIDISHESLIRQWGFLGILVDKEHLAATHYLRLVEANKLYNFSEKGHLSGTQLDLALDWKKEFKPTLAWAKRYGEDFIFTSTMAYLEASKNERIRKQNIEKSRRKKQRFLVFAIMALIAAFAIYTVIDRNKEIAAKKIASDKKNAFELHFQAKVLESKDPTTALRLEEQALKLYEYRHFKKTALALINNYSFYKVIVMDTAKVTAIDISLQQNRFLTGHNDGSVNVFDQNGNVISRFKAHEETIDYLALSPNGKSIFSMSLKDDPIGRLWDMQGKLMSEFKGEKGNYYGFTFSPESELILTHSKKNTVDIFKINGELITKLMGPRVTTHLITYSPDGASLLTTSGDRKVYLWDLNGNLKTEIKLSSNAFSAIFSPDGKSILTSTWDAKAQLWTLDGQLLQEFTGHWGTVLSTAFSPDGQTILSGSFDNTLRLWDLKGNMLKEYVGHEGEVIAVKFASDGKSIFSGAKDGTIRSWSLLGVNTAEFERMNGAVRSVVFAPDGKSILTGSQGSAEVWGLDGKSIQKIKTAEYVMIYSTVFAPDGRSILTGDGQGNAQLWNLNGDIIKEFDGHTNNIRSVAFAPDGNSFLSGSWDKTMRLWDLNGTVITECKSETGITSVAFAPDGKSILAGTFGKSLLWNLEGNLITEFKEPSELFVNGVAFSPDGQYVLTGSNDNSARLWNLKGEVIQVFRGPRGAIRSVAFAPDGKSIMTGSAGGIARIWDMEGNILEEFQGNTGTVFSVAYAPDNKSIVMGSQREAFLMKRIQLEEFLKSANIEPLSEAQKKEYGIKE